MKLLRRILTLLIVTAYVGATMLQAAPTYAAHAATNSSSINGMMHEHDSRATRCLAKACCPAASPISAAFSS